MNWKYKCVNVETEIYDRTATRTINDVTKNKLYLKKQVTK